jgi:RNA polymerase-binding transcription factor DksA
MGDIADRAQPQEEQFLAEALRRARLPMAGELEHGAAHGAEACIDCEQAIDATRRRLLPRACRCADCATDHERRALVRARQGLTNRSGNGADR